MQTLKQPAGSRLCGQACVAMVIGISLEEACERIGHRSGTTTSELASALYLQTRRLVVIDANHPVPRRAILKLSYGPGHSWHWVLWWDGALYDPDPLSRFEIGTFSSYLPLT